MNKLTVIGNLTRDPELRVTASGINVCTFSIAVNRKVKQGEEQKTDYFRATVWRQLGENCAKYLAKGRKVCVIGPVSVSTFNGNDGKTHANLEITAEDVEFLSPKNDNATEAAPANIDPQSGYQAVETDDLPF